LLQKGDRQKRISRPIVNFSIIGVALGLAVMIISIAVLSGFKNTIKDKVTGFGAHLQILNYDLNSSYESVPITKIDSIIAKVKAIKGIAHVQEFAMKPGILKTRDNIQGVIAKGVSSDYNWKFIHDHLLEGSVLSITDSATSKQTIISKKLANSLELKIGDSFVSSFVPSGNNKNVLYRKFTVTGIYETNMEEFDSKMIFVDLKHIQKLNSWNDNQISGYEIFIDNFDRIDEFYYLVWDEIGYGFMPDGSKLQVKSIEEQNTQVFEWLSLLDVNVQLVLIIMIVVACLNMISCILVLILEKTNMIGIMKAMGMPNKSISKIFIYNGTTLIVKGIALGNIIAFGLILIQMYFKIIPLDSESYFIEYVPVHIHVPYFILVNIGTFLVTSFLLVVPTAIISRIEPVKAIKFN